MRIALITGGVPFGGTTTFCLFLAAGLRSLGVPAEVFSFSSDHPMASEFESAEIPVYCVDEKRKIYEDRVQELYSKLATFAPSAVFAVLGAESFEMLRYVPKGTFRVGMIHDHLEPVYTLLEQYREIQDHIVAVSQHIADSIPARVPEVACTYIPHGVPLTGAVKRSPNPAQPLKLLFFGRLQESQKRVRIFPDIYAALRRRDIPFSWTIHGTGPEEGYLRERFSGAQEIRFSSPVEHDQLGKIISAHDIYLLTSAHEAGPLTLLEAMGRGVVPVCGDIPCLVQEVITENDGYRVPRDNPESYAEAIASLHEDRNRLEQLSEHSFQTINEHYTSIAMAKRYVQFVERHISTSRAGVWDPLKKVHPLIGQPEWMKYPVLRSFRRILKKLRS